MRRGGTEEEEEEEESCLGGRLTPKRICSVN